MRTYRSVYVGEYSTYVVPDDVVAKAIKMNAGKRLEDGRTRGARYLKWWGKSQDATQATILAIKKHCRAAK